jgi:hypothetical protein
MLGWGMYIACNIALAVIQRPSIETLAAFIFLMTMGFVQVREREEGERESGGERETVEGERESRGRESGGRDRGRMTRWIGERDINERYRKDVVWELF